MLTIQIEQIAHADQRYPTVGDWYFSQVTPAGEHNLAPDRPILSLIQSREALVILHIKASVLPDWKHTMLIAVHELVEVLLCINDGVSQEAVDKFDFKYERTRPAGDDSEPGDAVLAPYRNQHCYATAVERMLCAAFNLPWAEYESEIGSLYEAEACKLPAQQAAEACNCEPEAAAPEAIVPETAPLQPKLSEVGGCPPPAVEPEPPKAA